MEQWMVNFAVYSALICTSTFMILFFIFRVCFIYEIRVKTPITSILNNKRIRIHNNNRKDLNRQVDSLKLMLEIKKEGKSYIVKGKDYEYELKYIKFGIYLRRVSHKAEYNYLFDVLQIDRKGEVINQTPDEVALKNVGCTIDFITLNTLFKTDATNTEDHKTISTDETFGGKNYL